MRPNNATNIIGNRVALVGEGRREWGHRQNRRRIMLIVAILDVPDFYSALTNRTGCRRPLAHSAVGRTGVCYFLDAGHTAVGVEVAPLHGRRRYRLRRFL